MKFNNRIICVNESFIPNILLYEFVMSMNKSNILNMSQRTKQEVLSYLQRAEITAVGTSDMGKPRQRMMHYGVDDEFNIYVTSMKGDPKVIQWSNIPATAMLIHQGATFMEMEECEIIGRAEIIKNKEDKDKAISIMSSRSPIVANFIEIGAIDRLEFIRIKPFTVKYRFVPEIMQGQPPTVFEFPDNMDNSNVWTELKSKSKAWWEAIRPVSLTASLVPILLGGAIAYYSTGIFNWMIFILTLLGGLLIQIGTNMINDWHDAERDNENVEGIRPFTGGSRMIQLGLISRSDIGFFGFLATFIALIIGLYLISVTGWGLIPIVAYGLIAGLFYTGQKGRFSFINLAPGLGEILTATTFGVLMTYGAYYVQSGEFSLQAILISIPVSLLITNVLIINQFPDANSDAKSNKMTLVVRYGKPIAKNILFSLFAVTYLVIGILPLLGMAPFSIYFSFISAPFVYQAIRYTQNNYDKQAVDLISGNAHTAMAHLVAGLLLVYSYLLVSTSLVFSFTFLIKALLIVFWMWNYIESKRKDMEMFRASFSTKK